MWDETVKSIRLGEFSEDRMILGELGRMVLIAWTVLARAIVLSFRARFQPPGRGSYGRNTRILLTKGKLRICGTSTEIRGRTLRSPKPRQRCRFKMWRGTS